MSVAARAIESGRPMHHPLRRSLALIPGLVFLRAGESVPVLTQDVTPGAARGNSFAELGLPEVAVTITESAPRLAMTFLTHVCSRSWQ